MELRRLLPLVTVLMVGGVATPWAQPSPPTPGPPAPAPPPPAVVSPAVASPGAGSPAVAPPATRTTTSLASAESTPLTPQTILDRVDDLYRGRSSHGRLAMKVVTEHWTRELKLEFWGQGKDHSLIRILSPAKEKGTATLKAGRDLWNYLPKVRRVIKLPSSMMGGSWMGSHFTNDDLVKESRMADDYDSTIAFTGERDGAEVIEIVGLPRADAAVVWGKVQVTVRRADLLPLQVLFFDEDLALTRTMTFSGIRRLGERELPTIVRMVPVDKPGEVTEMVYEEIHFDLDLPADLFTLRSLER
ncbi:MAG: outer membrane lipoprotein-sorting protein [Myxococcota bacterium]|jgi:hypothetical protein|nr:outer membrane lipoprotein-sorting protein [Myxococcota bacterium]